MKKKEVDMMNEALKSRQECEGSCIEHTGEVIRVMVSGWGEFNYCEAAIQEDIRRGLSVEPVSNAALNK